ncbi:hypothetical protein DL93DRAFT_2231474 [Clavulina sp. PMI_390]|nr:hypothetical protein DL93DRAFT_2231474 [Clavulina sp. PMI_390]
MTSFHDLFPPHDKSPKDGRSHLYPSYHDQTTHKMQSSGAATLLKLPFEILSLILELAASRRDDTIPTLHCALPIPSQIRSSRSFHSLNLLCRRLREASLLSPRCWTNVVVVITDDPHDSTSPMILDTVLEHSKICLFDLYLYVDLRYIDGSPVHGLTHVYNLLHALQHHIHRCRSIRVCSGNEATQFSDFTQLMSNSISNCASLTSVSMIDRTSAISEDHYNRHRSVRFFPFWRPSGNKIASVEIDFELPLFALAMPEVEDLALPSNLKRLRVVQTLPRYLMLGALENCTQLEHLDWECADEAHSWEMDFAPAQLNLPHLKSLSLRSFALWDTFPNLSAPICEALCLHELEFPLAMEVLFPPLDTPDPAIFPKLKHLSFIHNKGLDPVTHAFLKRHHTLEEVLIYSAHSNWQVEEQCSLFDGLASGVENQSEGNSQSTSESSEPFMPSLHELWYITRGNHWPDIEDGPEGVALALTGALRRLVARRPTLRIKLAFDVEDVKILPKEVQTLLDDFGGRVVVPPPGAEPEWLKPWEFSDDS